MKRLALQLRDLQPNVLPPKQRRRSLTASSIDQPRRSTGAGFIIGAQSDSPTASYRPSTRGSSDIGLDPHSHIYGDWTSNVSSSGRPVPQYEGRGYRNSDPEFTSRGRQERRSATPEART
ncbi:hypothetical protein B0A55_12356, partial [Friedmanniomyces simplex]